LWLVALPVLVLLPGPVMADDAAEARIRFERGYELVQQGKLLEALDQYYVSNRLSPNPNAVFNIAACLETLERQEEAFGAYEEFLTHTLSDEDRAAGEQARARVLPKVARLTVETTPPGAAVYLDRKNLGQYGITPRTLAAPPGEHLLILELAGHHPTSSKVSLELGRETRAQATLRPLTGRVSVRTRPPGARIRLGDAGGRDLGTSPAELELAAGPRRLHLSVEGHDHVLQEVVVRPNETAVVDARLVAHRPPTGRLRLLTNVAAALVVVDGAEAGFSPAVLDLAAGEHEVRVAKPGFLPWTGTVHVDPARPLAGEVTLAPEEQETGRGPWPWALLSATGAATLVAAGLGWLALVAADDYRSAPGYDEAMSARDRAAGLNVVADVVWGVAGLGAVTTAVLFLVGEDVPVRRSAARFDLPGGSGPPEAEGETP